MSYEDKNLTCVECGEAFCFTVADQELFASRGYANEPKRCPTCRDARKQRRDTTTGRSDGGFRTQREMYPVVCASCGRETQVPFQPRQGRPVYCSDCYARTRPSTGSRR